MKQESGQNKWHKGNRRKESVLDLSITNVCEHFADVSFFYLSLFLWVLFSLFTSWEVPGAVTIIWIILQWDFSGVYVSVRVKSAWQMISWHSAIYWIKCVCFPGPPHRRLKDILSNVQNNIVSSLPLFQLFQCSRLKKFFLTTITSWVCCTGRVGKEGGSSQYVHIVWYIRQQIFVIRSDFWKGSDGAEKLEPGLVLPRQNQKLLNARNIREIHRLHVTFVCGRTAEMKCRFNVGCSFLTHESTWCTRMNDYSLTSIKSQLTMCTISRTNIIWNFTSARYILYWYLKRAKRKLRILCPCIASARNCSACMHTVVRCDRKGLTDLFPPAFVNSQIAQVHRLSIFHQVIFGSRLLCARVVKTSLSNFFSFKSHTFIG